VSIAAPRSKSHPDADDQSDLFIRRPTEPPSRSPARSRYNAIKGFGFIVSDRGGKDIFVHASALERAGIAGLTEGQRVTVDVIDGRKGPEAAGLRLT